MRTLLLKISLLSLILVIQGFQARHVPLLDMNGIQELMDEFGDELLTHQGLKPDLGSILDSRDGSFNLDSPDDLIHDEDDDTEPSINAEDVPHPTFVHNWGSNLKLGQVSGVTISPEDDPVVFHRGSNVWDAKAFDGFKLAKKDVIAEDTIVVLSQDKGEVKKSWGKNLFYMPHGIEMSLNGTTYVTDVGLHQVMRFPANSDTPDLILGEKFVPGKDAKHFCMPTSVAVSEKTGSFFVADGYCNNRIMKFDKDGQLTKIINGNWKIPHSVALFEDEDVLCVADRENEKIDCLRAGLYSPSHRPDLDVTGQSVIRYNGVGRTYGIAAKGTSLLSVNWEPEVRGITIDTSAEKPSILDKWGHHNNELTAPHDLAISQRGDAVYVVEIDPGKKNSVSKFEVIGQEDDLMDDNSEEDDEDEY